MIIVLQALGVALTTVVLTLVVLQVGALLLTLLGRRS